MELVGRIPRSSNETFLVQVTRAADNAYAVYKPEAGERPLSDFEPGLYRRERAASLLSESLGWGLDHGLCFSASYKLRTVIWDFAGEPIPDALLAVSDADVDVIADACLVAVMVQGSLMSGPQITCSSRDIQAGATTTPSRWSKALRSRVRSEITHTTPPSWVVSSMTAR